MAIYIQDVLPFFTGCDHVFRNSFSQCFTIALLETFMEFDSALGQKPMVENWVLHWVLHIGYNTGYYCDCVRELLVQPYSPTQCLFKYRRKSMRK